MNTQNTKMLIKNLLNENKSEREIALNERYSGGSYYPTKFSIKLSKQQILKYKASCRDIVRIIDMLKSENYNSWFLNSEYVSPTEKAPIIKSTLEQELNTFIDALSHLDERTAKIAFERACLKKNKNEIMEKYGASEQDIKDAEHMLITFYAYEKGEII